MNNRWLPKGYAEPGPFDPFRNPYMIPFMMSFWGTSYSRSVMVCGTQMGKTDAICNVICHRTDDRPVPILYIAPTEEFVRRTWEPRLATAIIQAPGLARKRVPGQGDKKTVKEIAGIKISSAWAGSPAALAGEPACIVIVDERSRMGSSVGKEGDVVELADARHDTYPDGMTGVISTPTLGQVETYTDEGSGLEFYAPSDEVTDPTWILFQEGTMHHWAWPCPECHEYFIPRFRNLVFPGCDGDHKAVDPDAALGNTFLGCPHCAAAIPYKDPETGKDRDWMAARGWEVAPGQRLEFADKPCPRPDGLDYGVDHDEVTAERAGHRFVMELPECYVTVIGPRPRSGTKSVWASGIVSPWKVWERGVVRYIRAVRAGAPDKVQGVINTFFGELYSIAGDAPEWTEVAACRNDYPAGTELPDNRIQWIVMGCDVQKDGIWYVVRGFAIVGGQLESWLIEYGHLAGNTQDPEVWATLAAFKDKTYTFGGEVWSIDKQWIDSKYRTPDVFAYCRNDERRNWCNPVMGRDTMAKPLHSDMVDVTRHGKIRRGAAGLQRWSINTDFFKSWVHDRVRRDPELSGQWRLPVDADDEYCKQIVSEVRVVKSMSGRVAWVQLRRDNHLFDCEYIATACVHSLGAFARVGTDDSPPRTPEPSPDDAGRRGPVKMRRRGQGSFFDR